MTAAGKNQQARRAGHMRYIENALRQEKKPDDDWAEDFDAPAVQE